MTSREAIEAPSARAVSQKSGRESHSLGFGEDLNAASVTTPTARDRFDTVRNDLGLLDVQFAADTVVMKSAHRRGIHHVKSRQVAARSAAISVGHDLKLPE